MNRYSGFKRGRSWDQAESSSFGPPKRGRFDGGGAMSFPGGDQYNSQGYQGSCVQPSDNYSHQEQGYSRGGFSGGTRGGFHGGSNRGGFAGGGTGGPRGTGRGTSSTISRLMDIASESSGCDRSFEIRGTGRGRGMRRGTGSTIDRLTDMASGSGGGSGFERGSSRGARGMGRGTSSTINRLMNVNMGSGGGSGVERGDMGGTSPIERGARSTIQRLMDMASGSDGGSGFDSSSNPSAGSYSLGGDSSFRDYSGCNQHHHSDYGGGGGGRGMHSQEFRGGGGSAGTFRDPYGAGSGGGFGRGNTPRGREIGYETSPQFEQGCGGFDVGWGSARGGFCQQQHGGQRGFDQCGGVRGGLSQGDGVRGGLSQGGGGRGGLSQGPVGRGGLSQGPVGRGGLSQRDGGQGGLSQGGGGHRGIAQRGGGRGLSQHGGGQGGISQRGGQSGRGERGHGGQVGHCGGHGETGSHADAPRGGARGSSGGGHGGDRGQIRGGDHGSKRGDTPGHGGKVFTRPNGTSYRRNEESILQYSSKFKENKLPIEDRFANLCEMAKPQLNNMPKIVLAPTTLEQFLLSDNVCLTPAYVFKGERVDGTQPYKCKVFRCQVYINNIFIASGLADSTRKAKSAACNAAIKALGTKNAQDIIATHEKVNVTDLGKQDADIVECPLRCGESNIGNILSVPESNEKKSWADFYIKEPEEVDKTSCNNSTGILRQSADFSKLLLTFDFTTSPQGVLCTVIMEGQTLATAMATEQAKAKNLASHAGLQKLRQTNWTIKVIKRDKPTPAAKPLTATLGRIHPNIPNSRERFNKNLTSYLETYFAGLDDHTKWLSLSQELNEDEKAAVFDVAKEMNLRVESKTIDGARVKTGDNKPIFLVVSKKLLCQDLFDYIWEKGGETWRYKLKAPGEFAHDTN